MLGYLFGVFTLLSSEFNIWYMCKSDKIELQLDEILFS